jgi:hypothetical protein
MSQEVKYLPLYIRGSEGLDICHFCEMVLIEMIREMINIAGRSRKVEHLERMKHDIKKTAG